MKYIAANLLRNEIERRMDKHWDLLPDADSPEDDWTHNELCELGAFKELEYLETFLDTLPEQPVEWKDEYREEDLLTRFAFYTYKNEEDDGVLYLSNVFVEEASRNAGFGTKILEAAEKVAETIGAITIRLKVKQDSPANAWYRKHGYGYIAFEGDYDWLEKNLEYLKPKRKEQPVEKKSNALFDKRVENCDPAVMKEVSDNVDKMLGRQPVEGLEEEINREIDKLDITPGYDRLAAFARHFYELGQQSKKPERNVVTREEAVKILKDTHDKALFSVRNALETLVPELAGSAVLDEEIKRYFKGWTESDDGVCHYQRIQLMDCYRIARHFAEWGKNNLK